MNQKELTSMCNQFTQMLGLSTAVELSGTVHEKIRLVCTPGETECFTDMASTIVIGLQHPMFSWCKSRSDYYETADYIRGHETQHVKSSTAKSLEFAIRRGREIIIERLCKDNGIFCRLVAEKDYKVALQKLNNECGIRLAFGRLDEYVHGIANSLEDGRIEAIRASENESFKKEMLHLRLAEWHREGLNPATPDYDSLSAIGKLMIITNQVLSLSTFSLYQKGYTEKFWNTPLQSRMEEIKPYIVEGVTGKRCRDMANACIKICESLSDILGEAAKVTGFEEALQKMLKEMLKNTSMEPATCAEKDEEENNSSGTPYPVSDLQPKESKQSSSENLDNEVSDSKAIQKENGQHKNSGKENDKDSNSGQSDKKNEDSKTSDSFSFDKNSDEAKESSISNTDENVAETKGKDPGPQKQGQAQKGGQSNGETGEKSSSDVADINSIEIAMKEAAQAAAGAAEDITEALDALTRRHKESQSMAKDVTERVEPTPQDVVNEINATYGPHDHTQLCELQRAYAVDTEIPSWLCTQVEALAQKLESLFHAKKRRFRKQLLDGKLDSSRIAMLAANEINVFKETKISKDVSACAEIMVDNSGSMGYGAGSKREAACVALTLIEMVFAKYFPIKIFAFDSCGSVIHEIIKNWNEHFSRSGAWNFLTKGRYGAGNRDGYSIRVATADLLTRSEKKKLLVVLSDGAPDSCKDVKNAVKEAREKGITVVGIFFSDWEEELENPKFFIDMYEKDYIVCEPGDIGENLIKVLKNFFV